MSKRNKRQGGNAPKKTTVATPAATATRAEQDVFEDLEKLCSSPGFVHALAYLCFRDNTVGFADELKADDLLARYSHDTLIRTELSTLMGLMVRSPIDYALPSPEIIQSYIDKAETLLRELHDALMQPWMLSFTNGTVDVEKPFSSASALREPIFYAAESAYSFQYRDLALLKYSTDRDWLKRNKSLDIDVAKGVLKAANSFLEIRHMVWLNELRNTDPTQWTMVPAFCLRPEDIAEAANCSTEEADSVLAAFSCSETERNPTFRSLSDFNCVNAYPLLHAPNGSYLLLQYQALAEALYETPFFWMASDKSYSSNALKNRGDFAEQFSEARLKRVFGDAHVWRGVRIEEAKGKLVSDIDTLVLFGDRAIVVQAKSKRLTIEARKGNDLQLKDDFKKAVQDAAEQAEICAKSLLGQRHKLIDAQGREVVLPQTLKRIYPLCIVTDHYPALSFQARQFLSFEKSDTIAAPLVTDVFALDAMTEMLSTPVRLLSYIELRARFGDRMMATHELTMLSYHLKRNIWVDGAHNFMTLSDDIGADLDVAMIVRREGVPGHETPEGILTKFRGTHYERMLEVIEANPNPAAVALGMLLSELSEAAINQINVSVDRIVGMVENDDKVHDFSCAFAEESTGLTIHCTNAAQPAAQARLLAHCEARKYVTKSASWIGVILDGTGGLRATVKLEKPWLHDAGMEELTRDMRKRIAVSEGKPGRNSLCPCGSRKKYKKCCLS